MNFKKLAVFASSCLFALTASATLPKDFMFHGSPIDSLCFFSEENLKEIDLQHCGLIEQKYVKKGKNKKLRAQGFTGYNWQNPEYTGSAQGYSYYKAFPAGTNQYWLYTINNGGGTGDFTAVHLVKRTTDTKLEIKTLKGGDRCNGGIQDVSEKNNQLTYSVNLTAYDFVKLANQSNTDVIAYDNLAACAVCCVAKAFYEVSPNNTPQLKYVDLGTVQQAKEMPEQGTQQNCFNKLYIEYVHLGNSQIKQDKLDQFVSKFLKSCKKAENIN